ncbi:hypothetical protein [Halorubrum yunnanense]|uniref:DUF4235 domain-containing protein n=1 Tax=Halorubrum yunnanense TaxID=1526162 RepID=A0ABD5YEW0_9EURY|nr:hypothetical protein [Halorubrum yunnanense]
MLDSDEMPCSEVDDGSKRKVGSLLVIGQGLLTAVAPGLSVSLTRKLLAKNFENADELEAKPAYRRQLRAVGIGAAAAGIAGYAMEVASEGATDEVTSPGDETPPNDADEAAA